jgi:Protein of unknown function (DUF2846)
MRFASVVAVGFCVLSLVAPAAAATATTPAPKGAAKPAPHPSGRATIYFIRPEGLIPALTRAANTPEIFIDGNKVGALKGGCYFSVSEPAGHHSVEARSGLFNIAWKSEMNFDGGKTYFLEVAPLARGAIGSQLLQRALAGTEGVALPGEGAWAHYHFLLLEVEQGREAIAKLPKATQ